MQAAPPPPPASVASSSAVADAPSCRVCWAGPEEGNALLQPCACRGSLAFIHRRCLQQWRQVCRENGRRRKAAVCEVCGSRLVLPGSRLAALAAAAAGGGDGDLTTDSGLEEEEEGDEGEGGGDERRAARRADAADRRRRRRARRRRAGFGGGGGGRFEDDDSDEDDDGLLVAGPFFIGNGQLVPALDLGAALADSLRDPLWWAGALHGALRCYVAMTGVAAAWRVWAQVLRAKRLGPPPVVGPGVVVATPSAHVTPAPRGQARGAGVSGGAGRGNNGNGNSNGGGLHFMQHHPHFSVIKALGGGGSGGGSGGRAAPAAPASSDFAAAAAARMVGAASAAGAPSSASVLQAAARAAQAAADPSSASTAAAASLACPAALRPFIVNEFTRAVEQGAQFQVAAHTTLAALASGADADAYSGLALGAVVASAVSELVFLPLLGAGRKGAAGAVARLVGATAWRLCAGALCTRDGYRLFCRGALAAADALAGWRARRRRRARRMAREQAAAAARAAAAAAVAGEAVVAVE